MIVEILTAGKVILAIRGVFVAIVLAICAIVFFACKDFFIELDFNENNREQKDNH